MGTSGYADTLTFTDLEGLWNNAGGNPKYAQLAAAVALAESGGQVNATNHNTNGTTDVGLWQINSIHGAQASYDPMTNARAAVAISGDGANWRPWCTAWGDGACGTQGGGYLSQSSPAIRRFSAVVKGGGADLNPGTMPGAKTPQITDRGTLNIESHPCRFHVELGPKIASQGICFDKLVATLAISAGGTLILAGVAVLLVATIERTPAGRAATQALAVATPIGRAVRAATPAARTNRRAAAEAASARRDAPVRQAAAQEAAERRRQQAHDAAEARKRTAHRRAGTAAAAAERRREEAHLQRQIHRTRAAAQRGTGRSYDGPNAHRSTRSIVAANRARNTRTEPPPF